MNGVGRLLIVAQLMLLVACSSGGAIRNVVCSEPAEGCDFVGNRALQEVVDATADGGLIVVRAGRYVAEGFRDVPHGDVTVRAYVFVDNRVLEIIADGTVVLDGGEEMPSTAIVIKGGKVKIDGIQFSNFFAESPDDQIYDGHGVFVIDGDVEIDNVSFKHIEKMSVSTFGNSDVVLQDCQILDGHVGIWVEDEARMTVKTCRFVNNDSAGIAAYASALVEVIDSYFDGNLDDGIYAADQAIVSVTSSTFTRNRPYAIRSIDKAEISVTSSEFIDNEQNRFEPDGE